MEQPNQEKIRTLREKENHKYLGILEADTIKQTEMKEKKKKKKEKKRKASDKRENFSKPNSAAKISLKLFDF